MAAVQTSGSSLELRHAILTHAIREAALPLVTEIVELHVILESRRLGM